MIEAVANALNDRSEAEAALAFRAAWIGRAEKPPTTFDEFIGRPAKPQSDEAMVFAMRTWAAATQAAGGAG